MGSQPFNAPKDTSSRRILDALRAIVRELRMASASSEKQFGLSAAQLFVLHVLRDGRTCSLNDLADWTETDQSSVSVVVRKLVQKQLVLKRTCDEDRRRLEITLSAAGRKLAEAAPQPVQERLMARMSALSPEERDQLSKLLERLALQDQETPPMFFEEPKAKPRAARNRG
jgi:DNA-binding MarR family transcriptional regulator